MNIFQDFDDYLSIFKKQNFELQRQLDEKQGRINQLMEELKNTKIESGKLNKRE